jgi:hypothetical protein
MLAGAGVPAELLGAMESEHAAMAAALADTGVAMSRLADSGSAAEPGPPWRACSTRAPSCTGA